MNRAKQEFAKLYKKLAENIFFFCDLMGFKPTWQQAEVLQAVQDGHRYIAVKSGKGPGTSPPLIKFGGGD